VIGAGGTGRAGKAIRDRFSGGWGSDLDRFDGRLGFLSSLFRSRRDAQRLSQGISTVGDLVTVSLISSYSLQV